VSTDYTAGPLTEIQIQQGDDNARCTGCFTHLPVGAPAWADTDSLLCADCGDAEISLRTVGAETPAERRHILAIVQASIRAAVALARHERHAEFPVPAQHSWTYSE
jgi:hypothetical protein